MELYSDRVWTIRRVSQVVMFKRICTAQQSRRKSLLQILRTKNAVAQN